MKRIPLWILVLTLLPSLGYSQWTSLGSNFPIYGMTIKDSFLFVSQRPQFNEGALILRYPGWENADTGIGLGDGNYTYFTTEGQYLYASAYGHHRIYATTDDGSNWIELNGDGPVCANSTYVFGQVFIPTTIIRSKDFGQTWDSVGDLAVNCFVGTDAYVLAQANDGIYRTLDNGTNWLKAPSPPSALSLQSYAIINSRLFAGDSGVFASTDSGWTWTQHTLTNRIVNTLASYKTYLFAGTDTGVFMSSDSGVTWTNMSVGLLARPHYVPNVRFLTILDTTMFAGVDMGDGYWAVESASLPEMTGSSSVVAQLPPGDTVEIFPNPTASEVSVLAGGTSVLGIQVLNVLGVQVQSLPSLQESSTTIDLSRLASGTYFLEIQTEKGTVLRKVIRE